MRNGICIDHSFHENIEYRFFGSVTADLLYFGRLFIPNLNPHGLKFTSKNFTIDKSRSTAQKTGLDC